MGLTLTIENETNLPDGGPLSFTVAGKRGLDIGRDTHLDWTLPDPSRVISGKHCEVRYRDGGYWLYDVSTNGTFLNGSDRRLQAPHRLRNGDRLSIGPYLIAVVVHGEEAAHPAPVIEQVSYNELWREADDAAPPLDRALLQTPRERAAPVKADFLDWAADVPETFDRESPRPAPPSAPASQADDRGDEFSWARGSKALPPEPEPAPPVPSPRRPVWVGSEPDGPWASPASAPASSPASEQEDAPSTAPHPPVAPPAAAQAAGAGEGDFVRALARGARVPEHVFAQRDSDELAEQLGVLMRVVAENMQQLLTARLQAKRLARSASHTMIEALDNNPLKFSPTADDALRIMFGPPTKSYLDARRAFEQSFADLKTHQIKTYAAMQQALRRLVADLDPQAIDRDTDADRGLAAMVGSRKAKLWDAYLARWQAKARRREGGLADVFMDYFAEAYDGSGSESR
jgi:type VI secretion system protein ImpI